MAAADHEPTLGEVYRLIVSLTHDVKDMRKDLISRAEYDADQEANDRRHRDAVTIHTHLDSKITFVDTKYAAELKDVRASLDSAEKEQRQNRAKWLFALVMAGATPIIGILVSILLRGTA